MDQVEESIKLKPFKNNDENQNKIIRAPNDDELDSIFEPVALNLIAEYYGWNKSTLADLDESEETAWKQMRLGYPQRTIHLANKYNMKKKNWNLKNNLKVEISFQNFNNS